MLLQQDILGGVMILKVQNMTHVSLEDNAFSQPQQKKRKINFEIIKYTTNNQHCRSQFVPCIIDIVINYCCTAEYRDAQLTGLLVKYFF